MKRIRPQYLVTALVVTVLSLLLSGYRGSGRVIVDPQEEKTLNHRGSGRITTDPPAEHH